MIELRNYSIRTRLYAMALLGIVVMLAMGLRGLQLLGQAGELIEEFAKIQVGAVADAGHVRAGVGNLRRFEKDVLINMADKGTVDHYIKSWEGIYGDVDAGLKKLAQEKLHPDVAVIVGGMRDGLAGYRAAFLKVADGVRNGEFADAGAANKALTPAKPAIRQIDENLVKLIERIDADGAASLEIIHANERNVRWRQALLVGLGGAAIVAFTFFNIRSILEPLQAVMATAERIASKDLRQDVDTRGVDETADMMRGVQGVQEVLRGVVGTVSHATDSIATASAEVASGSHDLSQRTEEAASRLQATASAMDELTASVRSNADSARQASHLARQAAEVTQRGGTVVGEVVDTMGRISASSHKIIDIISVIDSIAFQTNILALNAAVEAARAGEQGRGFAVVAAEVRNLAQRSAGAAKEIKSLIGASTESVDSGARLVQQAGDTMREIVSSIERVNGIISEISAASSEQAQGINQIGEAISQLDQMTQQNAALVEQSAAAASSLQQQAEDLASSVAVFRMG